MTLDEHSQALRLRALFQQTDPWDPDFPYTDETPIDAVFPFKEPWKPGALGRETSDA